MTKERALDIIRDHLTNLHSNPNVYEDGTCNIIYAIEEVVIPMLKKRHRARSSGTYTGRGIVT